MTISFKSIILLPWQHSLAAAVLLNKLALGRTEAVLEETNLCVGKRKRFSALSFNALL